MRNLNRIGNYWNKVEALRDWERISNFARERGYGELVDRFLPASNTWRSLDKATGQLREALKVNGIEYEPAAIAKTEGGEA